MVSREHGALGWESKRTSEGSSLSKVTSEPHRAAPRSAAPQRSPAAKEDNKIGWLLTAGCPSSDDGAMTTTGAAERSGSRRFVPGIW
ncbi:hypothetical protein G5I_03971 [Acromyrmex echinatior]|uniref:Uncharacterized protein n=1 Tax=Acromyrmex echinatior TaxID=103372 RepID=F4WEG5_ACREC|nr:hypothetical protein G5I_03971 [Acromyrmex echinatior]